MKEAMILFFHLLSPSGPSGHLYAAPRPPSAGALCTRLRAQPYQREAE